MARSQRFRGVRQRHWGSWVSEIRHPLTKRRVWLGTFPTAEDAAHAHDEATRLLCGPYAKTNFPYTSSSTSSNILSPELQEKLLRSSMQSTTKSQYSEKPPKFTTQKLCQIDFESSHYVRFASWKVDSSVGKAASDLKIESIDNAQHLSYDTKNSDDDIIADMIEELLQSSSFDSGTNLPAMPLTNGSENDSVLFPSLVSPSILYRFEEFC
eukprot:c41123_g1_i1 orf=47-679(+)